MATSNRAKTREQLAEIIRGVSPFSDNPERVVVGRKDLDQSDDFFKDLVDVGPFVAVKSARVSGANMSTKLGNYEVKVMVYWAYEADADYDYTDLEDVLEELEQAMLNSGNWTNGATHPAPGFEMDVDEDFNIKPRVILTTYTLPFYGPYV